MAQWTNIQRNKKFVNPMRLHITYGGLHLAKPGITAGKQAVSQGDEIWARFEILKACFRSKY